MNPKLIAQILPTKTNGKRIVGTGYPISDELVITAYHVVCFDERDESIPVCVRWPDIQDDKGEPYEVKVTDQLLIRCTDDDGIAILKCKVPGEQQVLPSLKLSGEPPNRDRNDNWDSLGYPRYGKDNETNEREKEEAGGKFCFIDSGKAIIKLKAGLYPKDGADWAGMSGAPVFQGKCLYGIIIDKPNKVEMALRAISIPWLLKHKSNELRGWLPSEQNRENYIALIKTQIKEHIQAIDGIPLHKSLASNYYPESIFDGLVAAAISDPIGLLEDYRIQCEHVLENASEAHHLFVLLLGLISPAHYVREASLHRIPVKTKMATELCLSASYLLPPRLKQDDDETLGEFAIDVSGLPEAGWQPKAMAGAVMNAVKKGVYKISPDDYPVQADEGKWRKLNRTLLTRRKNLHPELIYIVTATNKDREDESDPVHNSDVCKDIHDENCLPDLPIAIIGLDEAPLEWDIDAMVDEFFLRIKTL